MGVSKKSEFTEEQNKLAEIAKALGHPARIAIMDYLIKNPGCICGDIVLELPLSQATVSQHLKELKNAGLIIGDIQPPKVCYCVNSKYFDKIKVLLDSFFAKFKNSCC